MYYLCQGKIAVWYILSSEIHQAWFLKLNALCLGKNCGHTNLQHVIDDVEFDDRLTPDDVVQHGDVQFVQQIGADHQDDHFQEVTNFSRL